MPFGRVFRRSARDVPCARSVRADGCSPEQPPSGSVADEIAMEAAVDGRGGS
jgi:hypothetical protein